MPSRIIECFAEWKSEEMAKLDSLIKQCQKIEHRVLREEIKLEHAVIKFNNQKIIDKGEKELTVTTTIMEGETVDCDEA
tara:strand:+ start:802 stop:1038 length:237 start_codon:yes stop_codon:yes gene_type:complete